MPAAELHTILTLKKAAQSGRVDARMHAQIDTLSRKETKEGKPYFEVLVTDAEARLSLRAWE
jgi:hypothetical protein